MHKLFLTLLIIITFSAGCSRGVVIPEDVLPPDKMTAFLTDVHIAEAALTVVQHNGMDVSYYKKLMYAHIYEKHNTDAEIYKSSVAFYSYNLKMYDNIQADVITALNRKQIELTGID